jgi:spermidine/putrescine transport system ATP-binding protein
MVNTVFQDYALFPHMNVVDNVAFGLRMDGLSRRDARSRASEALAGVDLDEYADHRVAALSGGQRQRVALARALVKRPKVLLLDEPFAALDLQLRRRMQLELRELQRKSGTTFVFVTHDQEEAAVLSDRVVVLRDGQVQQVGAPEEIYDNPGTRFVAEFIGESNVFDVQVADSGELDVAGIGKLPPPPGTTVGTVDGAALYALRPERVRILSAGTSGGFSATVREMIRVGETVKIVVTTGEGARLNVSQSASAERVTVGQQVTVSWDPADGRVLID